MSYKAIAVVGPESSGSKAVSEFLLASGCTKEPEVGYWDGYPESYQAYDSWTEDDPRPVVVHRSYPYAYSWPTLAESLGRFPGPHAVIVVTRQLVPMIRSQIARGHVRDEQQAEENIAVAYRTIWEQVTAGRYPYYLTSVEWLRVGRPVAGALRSWAGLSQHVYGFFREEDLKHYGGA